MPEGLTVPQATEWIERADDALKRAYAVRLAIVDASDGSFLGQVGIGRLNWEQLTGEIFYWLAAPARGRGYATRAVRLLSAWTFDVLDLARIEITVDPDKRGVTMGRRCRRLHAGRRLAFVPAVQGTSNGRGDVLAPADRSLNNWRTRMGVLDGVKVVEVAEHGFVPSAAAILAEWGADVVKVERPTGDPLRLIMSMGFVADTGEFNWLFEQFNRNKRGVSFDLRTDDGRAVLDRLIGWADVYITNFLPSARTKLRLDPDDIWAVNPRCIYAIGSGQGLEGPDRDQGGFDAVSYWARGGLAHMLTPQGAPLVQPRGALGDGPGGAYLAGGVAAALFRRERTGEATVVDVSLLGAAVWTLSNDLVPTTILQAEPKRHVAGKSLGSVLVGSYRTADERWISLNMLDPERHWEPTCQALGLDDLIGRPEYATAAQRAERSPELHPIFSERIASLPLAELKERA